jgi:hypothetical protein
VAILGGSNPNSTFESADSVSRTKGYLVFILVFTAISNCIVSKIELALDVSHCPFLAIRWFHLVLVCNAHNRVILHAERLISLRLYIIYAVPYRTIYSYFWCKNGSPMDYIPMAYRMEFTNKDNRRTFGILQTPVSQVLTLELHNAFGLSDDGRPSSSRGSGMGKTQNDPTSADEPRPG